MKKFITKIHILTFCEVSADNHVALMMLSVTNETNGLLDFNGWPLQFQIEIN